jgi:WXG100 protein secretion system (Wss), protein YukD
MQTVLITLAGPVRRIDLKLPAEVAVGDLLPKLLELCGPQLAEPQAGLSQWRLVLPSRGLTLPHNRSLRDCVVVDGTVLYLQDSTSSAVQQPQTTTQTFRPKIIRPNASTGGIGVKWNIPPMDKFQSSTGL